MAAIRFILENLGPADVEPEILVDGQEPGEGKKLPTIYPGGWALIQLGAGYLLHVPSGIKVIVAAPSDDFDRVNPPVPATGVH